MIGEIYVLDDVISPGYQDLVERELMSKNAPWHFQRDIALDVDDPNAKLNGRTPGLSHVFFDVDSGGIRSPMMHYMTMPIMFEAVHRIGYNAQGLIQSRSFMHFPIADKLRKPYDNVHVDYGIEHLVCLYYVNETDGDTIIFDKKFNKQDPNPDFSKINLKIKDRITPKKGRCILFDGDWYHSSSGPTEDVRCIINFDVV
jgi:hypothetical protein